MKLSSLTLCVLTTLSLSGCTSYSFLKMQSDFIAASHGQNAPDIITTDTYNRMTKQGLSVAVKAPDQCTSYTADQRTGQARSGETILKTDCGLEMGEIERALARAGYKVISWKAFNQQTETEKNLTKAAADLGASIIFQINSLENSIKSLGQNARWERSYYQSNPLGATIAPTALDNGTRGVLASRFIEPLENKFDTRTFNVTIDAAAIDVRSGQTIWYYRWGKATDLSAQAKRIEVFAQCDNDLPFTHCFHYSPPMQNQNTFNIASGDTIGVSTAERPEDIAKAEYAKLYREVVSNLVESFTKGTS